MVSHHQHYRHHLHLHNIHCHRWHHAANFSDDVAVFSIFSDKDDDEYLSPSSTCTIKIIAIILMCIIVVFFSFFSNAVLTHFFFSDIYCNVHQIKRARSQTHPSGVCCGQMVNFSLSPWLIQMEDLSRDPRGRFNDISTIWRVPRGCGLDMLITPSIKRLVCVCVRC